MARPIIDEAPIIEQARSHFWTTPDMTAVLAAHELRSRPDAREHAEAVALRLAVSRRPEQDLNEALALLLREPASTDGFALLAVRTAELARAAGKPRHALTLLDRVLTAEVGESTAIALALAARCLADLGRRSRRGGLFSEAERLARTDRRTDAISATLCLAWVHAHAAAAARQGGALDTAADHAEQALDLVAPLPRAAATANGLVAALTHQLVHVRLALGAGPQGLLQLTTPVLAEAVRADNVHETAWLAIATAIRLHDHRGEQSRTLLEEALALGLRFGLDDVVEAAAQELSLVVDAERGVELIRIAQVHRDRTARAQQHVRATFEAGLAPMTGAVAELHDRIATLATSLVVPTDAPVEPSPRSRRDVRLSSGTPEPVGNTAEPVAETAEAAPEWLPRHRDEPEPSTETEKPALVDSVSTTPLRVVQADTETPPPGLAHVPGLVVTEGSGGRRRAPEPEDVPSLRPVRASEPDTSVEPPAPPQPSEPAEPMRFADLLAEAMDVYHRDPGTARARHRKPETEEPEDTTALRDLSPSESFEDALTRHDWRGDAWWYGDDR